MARLCKEQKRATAELTKLLTRLEEQLANYSQLCSNVFHIPCVVHLGGSSIRDTNYGTPLIRELVKTLYKHSSHTDLATLFYEVQERVRQVTRKLAGTKESVVNQTPIVFKTLTKRRKVYLFPKYKISPQSEI
ncbi:hypothetical protein EB796_024857 [Bugula neritina]|uniref:Caspase family p10 domain-containing protein n=1 Tax=Bugula neritina TaxID=10212 RepID=A0A7J7ISH4_BUGNE|nr:hypothetical protein EB796_024857 [Bugula neritina]